MRATALIAEDEPLLAQSLSQDLATLWPELEIVAMVADGASAVRMAQTRRPHIVFLDIHMPGLNGLEAAQALAQDLSMGGQRRPLVVYITAYDQHAVAAFEHAAVDYVLKPVRLPRLQRTCERLRAALAAQERAVLPLHLLQASQGAVLHMVPVDEVIYFEAADKYVRAVTAQAEHVLRMPLRELLPRLPVGRFWQVHRGTLVRADAIATARREDNGRYTLSLKGCADQLAVSRVYTHLFKGM